MPAWPPSPTPITAFSVTPDPNNQGTFGFTWESVTSTEVQVSAGTGDTTSVALIVKLTGDSIPYVGGDDQAAYLLSRFNLVLDQPFVNPAGATLLHELVPVDALLTQNPGWDSSASFTSDSSNSFAVAMHAEAIPEPSTYLLGGAGALLLWSLRRS